jgi:hypothetical protein
MRLNTIKEKETKFVRKIEDNMKRKIEKSGNF